ncbi:NAC domain-containing protein 30-like [Rosa sericea]
MKCIKPRNKRSRRVDHQEVMENTLMNMPSNNKNHPLTSTEMNMPSNNYYFEKDLPQSSTTSSTNANDQQFSISENLDFVADHVHTNLTPINHVKGIDHLSMPGNNYHFENGLQQSSTTTSSTNNDDQQCSISENLHFAADLGN